VHPVYSLEVSMHKRRSVPCGAVFYHVSLHASFDQFATQPGILGFQFGYAAATQREGGCRAALGGTDPVPKRPLGNEQTLSDLFKR